jgi:hypothetical protein
MYDSSKAAGFYSQEEGEEDLDGYNDFLTCMTAAQGLVVDEEAGVTEASILEAEHECTAKSYRNTAMASFFFYDRVEAEDEVENAPPAGWLDEFMNRMKFLKPSTAAVTTAEGTAFV